MNTHDCPHRARMLRRASNADNGLVNEFYAAGNRRIRIDELVEQANRCRWRCVKHLNAGRAKLVLRAAREADRCYREAIATYEVSRSAATDDGVRLQDLRMIEYDNAESQRIANAAATARP